MSKMYETQYCSWCFQKTTHELISENVIERNDYKCMKCGNVSSMCRVPNCYNMAKGTPREKLAEGFKDKFAESWTNEFCAEHDGTIANFENLNKTIEHLSDYRSVLLANPKTNMVKIAGGAVGALTVAGVIALTAGAGAPAVAAALGNMGLLGTAGTGTLIVTLNGAALTSASLAAIGGTMAAGTSIISAVGAALGGIMGANIANSYLKDDKSFDFRHLNFFTSNTRTIFINGFTQERDVSFVDWKQNHSLVYGDESLYGMNWSSKELNDLWMVFGKGSASHVAHAFVSKVLKGGPKKYNPLAPILSLVGVFDNPWHVAMIRAGKAGAMLADAIMRTEEKEFDLVGHSLGARVIFYALQSLSSAKIKKVRNVILLGGAVGKKDKTGWKIAANGLKGNIYNCFSEHDDVLKFLYQSSLLGQSTPIGIGPIEGNIERIVNTDCSSFISGHMKWKENYAKVLEVLAVDREVEY